jgi:hypothetical protein
LPFEQRSNLGNDAFVAILLEEMACVGQFDDGRLRETSLPLCEYGRTEREVLHSPEQQHLPLKRFEPFALALEEADRGIVG